MSPELVRLEQTIKVRSLVELEPQYDAFAINMATYFVAFPFDLEVFCHLDELRKPIWAQ